MKEVLERVVGELAEVVKGDLSSMDTLTQVISSAEVLVSLGIVSMASHVGGLEGELLIRRYMEQAQSRILGTYYMAVSKEKEQKDV